MGCGCSTTEEVVRRKRNFIGTSKNSETFLRKFEFMNNLGNGSYGRIRLYRDRNVHEMKFAIKMMKKSELKPEMIENIQNEVGILKKLDHPNIVKYFDTYEDEGCIQIVMEYIPGENLNQVIIQKKLNKFDERDAAEIIKCLCKAVFFLHSKNILHRDIKPENILFSKNRSFETLKLIDFGLSSDDDNNSKSKHVISSFISPESLDKIFTKKSDAYSIGAITYYLLLQKLPYSYKDMDQLKLKIQKCDYNKKFLEEANISNEAKNLIKNLFVVDPNLRWSVDEVISSPWLKKYEARVEDIDKELRNFFKVNNVIESFRNFERYSNFKKEILFSIAKTSNEDEIRQLKKLFIEFDKDNTGTIEKEEVQLMFKKLGITTTEDDINMIWKSLDFHQDGNVNYTEFLAASLSEKFFMKEEKLLYIFNFFDELGNKFITPREIINVLQQNEIPHHEEEILKIFEGNAKKRINFEEFKTLMQNDKKSYSPIKTNHGATLVKNNTLRRNE